MTDKIYTMTAPSIDKDGHTHMITLVGRYRKIREVHYVETNIKQQNGLTKKILEPEKMIKREFAMGYSICHPEDEYDKTLGESIGLRRIDRGETIGTLASYDVTMLNPNQCSEIINYEMLRIVDNIDDFIK